MDVQFVLLFALLTALWAALFSFFAHRRTAEKGKRMQQRINEFERLLSTRAELANEIAHEIKNPLTAILCSAEALDMMVGQELEEPHRKSLNYIREYSDNLLRLLTDYLDVSVTEGSTRTMRREEVPVVAIIESLVGLLQATAIRKKIEVEVKASNIDIEASIDPKHLKQVVFNLLHNALRFTPEGGRIEITVESDFPRPFVKIDVRDNGSGISRRDLERLFTPYNTGSRGPVGTGIGLSLSRELVELAGGSLDVQSAPGVGTVFSFTVPLPDSASPMILEGLPLSEVVDPDGQPLRGQRILLVDEDLGSREMIATLLESWGGKVDRIALIREIPAELKPAEYSAVMIGHEQIEKACEIARIVRKRTPSSDTNIVVAVRNSQEGIKAVESGADSCVERPLKREEILTKLLSNSRLPYTH